MKKNNGISVSIIEEGNWLQGSLEGVTGFPPTQELNNAWNAFVEALVTYRQGKGTILPHFEGRLEAPVFMIKTRWANETDRGQTK